MSISFLLQKNRSLFRIVIKGGEMKENFFRDRIVKLGLFKTVLLLTFLSVSISMLMTFAINRSLGYRFGVQSLWMSILIPMVIAPLFGSITTKMYINLHHMEEKMRELATKDFLTGVYTRSAFSQRSEALFNISARTNLSIAVLYLDIDHFKSINDKYGHQSGDQVLVQFCSRLMERGRRSDLIGRIGGEEFAIILLNAEKEDVLKYAERIREDVFNTDFECDGNKINVTVSIGITFLSKNSGRILEELFREADTALYEAKNSGRNKVCLYKKSLLNIK